jgi:putative flippase GtrA
MLLADRQSLREVATRLWTKWARPVRYGTVGAVTFVLNLGLLVLFKRAGLPSVPAYALALALSVQFNFACSQFWVWGDRHVASFWGRDTAERWVTFHGCIGVSLAINFVVFAAAQVFMPDVLAALVGVGASTLAKFLSLDRLAFKDRAGFSET